MVFCIIGILNPPTANSPTWCKYGDITAGSAWLVAIGIPTSSSLFFFRVRAAYIHSRFITALFLILWISTFAAFIGPFASNYKMVGRENGVCTYSLHFNGLLLAVPFVPLLVFDSSVVVAISIHIMRYSPDSSWKARFRLLFGEKNIGHISRLFLRTCQLYYLYVPQTSFLAEYIQLMMG